jgi:putative membrane protein
MLISAAIQLAANAVGLIVAAAVLDDMTLDASGFLLAVAIFTVVEVIALPFFRQMALQRARALAGGTALVATLVALIATAAITDGLTIDGFSTWLLATGIVWVATLLAAFILPAIFIKNRVEERRSS